MKRKTDVAYLTDLFTKFNMVNLQLQGDSLNLIKTKSILSAFLARVKLMKQNIGRCEFSQFQNLSQTSCQEDDVSTYVQHLNAIYSDFESRFEDILTMVISPWIINPYGDIEETNVIIQEELTELSTNEELKVQFKNGYQQFWLQNNIPVTYPLCNGREPVLSFVNKGNAEEIKRHSKGKREQRRSSVVCLIASLVWSIEALLETTLQPGTCTLCANEFYLSMVMGALILPVISRDSHFKGNVMVDVAKHRNCRFAAGNAAASGDHNAACYPRVHINNLFKHLKANYMIKSPFGNLSIPKGGS
ncbi:unnamed protein product [Acanthoscelides obtectus]|uniref:Uncharacterized protein n=1 Tax=Acanthoscelides obtectus TaxID=200917 RepID=A0A9P0MGC6_ACAOB|nr:unnamed protein product [Acanthoscelides obtectus]CAK1637542.1 General transcription factor II-I repeat domain-containing protein 2 [Acanthoscelides obtectus]